MHRNQQKQQQQSNEIPGTQSKVSNKKGNNSFYHYLWEFDHDPNDSFLNNMINDKMRKHHSSQQSHPKYFLDNLSNVKNQENQYHSMVDSSGVANHCIGNQYGLATKKNQYHGSHEKSGRPKDNRAAKNSNKNQLQRVLMATQINPSQNIASPLNPNSESSQQTNAFLNLHVNLNKEPPMQLMGASRQEDILQHKRISNINYLMRQLREIISLTRMESLQAEIQESRGSIIKLEIQLRRIRISLRNSSSGSRMSTNSNSNNHNGKKEEGNNMDNVASIAAMQEYGYLRKESKSPNNQPISINLCKLARKSAHNLHMLRPSPRNMASNLIKIQSNLKNGQNMQARLASHIQKQRRTLNTLIQKQQHLTARLQTAVSQKKSQFHRSPKKSNIVQAEPQTQQTFPKPHLQHPQHPQHHSSKKDSSYHLLLLEKYKIISETLQKFKHHYRYKENKLQEENKILKEQVKMVDSQIYDTGISLGMISMGLKSRAKNSITSQKNNSHSKHHGPYYCTSNPKISISGNTPEAPPPKTLTHSKSRRKLLVRSPVHKAQSQTLLVPEPHQSPQKLHKYCSQEVLSTSHPQSSENIQSPYLGRFAEGKGSDVGQQNRIKGVGYKVGSI